MKVTVTNLATTVSPAWIPHTYYGGTVDRHFAHSGSGGTRQPVDRIQRLADVNVEVGVGVGGVILALVIRLVTPSAVDEGRQVDNGATILHGTFWLLKRKEFFGVKVKFPITSPKRI